jgi:hypothetical protein
MVSTLSHPEESASASRMTLNGYRKFGGEIKIEMNC